ncbi:2-methylisocitrate lyase [Mycobacterium paraense]|uniref:2-methylisocitrate lyase n=1 Tax=Mycobacterium paraense TaxID=767916 RepID=A0A1X2A567_9MYCO|nr:isocitrate lyase/phosphoenolpyruvate mutase family protein [Mycobacterium paraense]ORW34111.1 2-methylisocitrate lyase [Mycobacterium paraense]ORW37391.1 2-methylisocitrate lyase [Mycobacterium paraense]ORW40623.1 2-methylisocitrate lyase [Mycobacterium paraense]
MDSKERTRRCEEFRRLHARDEMLVLPNPWDVGTARLFANMGFRGLATTSAGLAFSLGRRDGDGAVSRDETLAHVRTIVDATPLPVTADLENGFGDTPEAVAETVRLAGEAGLAGASIEDATYRPDQPVYPAGLAVERVQAAVEAARALPYAFTLTARAENFIRGRPDLDDTLSRLLAYEAAGADVLYAPGLPDESALRLACRSLARPVNYVAGIGRARFTVAELKEFGVRRVTIGTSFCRAGLTAVVRAAREVLDQGSFDYTDTIYTVAECNELIDPRGDFTADHPPGPAL